MATTETTTYKVETLYVTRDEASRGLHDVEHAARGAHEATTLLKHTLQAVGVGIGIGIHQAKHAFIDFNKEVENAKISLSTMLRGNYGVDWDTATKGANGLYAEFQRFSQLTPVTTQEMLEFGRGVAVATAQAGGGIKDITNITEQGVVAAKALGMESNYASLELTEMLMGNVSRRMRFAQQILGFARMDEKEFKKLSAGERMSVVERVLNSPAMRNATTAFSTSFSGVVSTMEDKLQILGGKIGLPLFKAVTAEVTHWNAWLDKNQEKVEQFAHTVSEGLVTAFRGVKDAFAFVYDHSETFITIGKIWAAIKIGGMLGNGVSGMFGGLGLAGLGKNVTGFGGAMGALGPALAAGMGGYQLGKAMGLDKVGESIGGTFAHLTGRTNEYADRVEELTIATKALEAAQRHAAYAAGHGDDQTFGTRLRGNIDLRTQQIEKLHEILMRGSGGNLDKYYSYLATHRKASDFDSIKDELNKVGLATTDIGMAGGLMSLLTQLRQQNAGAEGRSELAGMGALFANAVAPMIGLQQNQLNEAKTLNDLFGTLNRALASGKSLFDKSVLDEVMADLKAGANDPFKSQAKVNQNITNNIQVEVSAKDPDRWMAELDAKVQRKIRAPSQAKGAVITRGGM